MIFNGNWGNGVVVKWRLREVVAQGHGDLGKGRLREAVTWGSGDLGKW